MPPHLPHHRCRLPQMRPACPLLIGCRGLPLDYTAPLGALFHRLTLIPVPGAGAGPATPAAAAAKRGKTPRTSRGRAALAATPASAAAKASSPARGAAEPELWGAEQEQQPQPRRTSRRKTLIGKKD